MGIIGNSNDRGENLFVFRQTWAVELKKLKKNMDSEKEKKACRRRLAPFLNAALQAWTNHISNAES